MHLLTCAGVTRRPFFQDRGIFVDAGEIVVLHGPTGAGKTLFLRTLGDLDPAESGRFELDGKDRTHTSPREWRRAVLYVHQSAPRLPGTVGANLQRIHRLRGLAPRPVPDDLPSLDPNKDAARLSGGEAQLLALHRALAVNPRVLLLDEATSALDRDRSRRVEAVLVKWVREGRAIVWISHEEALAERLGARAERFP